MQLPMRALTGAIAPAVINIDIDRVMEPLGVPALQLPGAGMIWLWAIYIFIGYRAYRTVKSILDES